MLDTIRTDRGVIRKVLRGNSDAFRVLVDRYSGMVYGIACAHVGNVVDAEDISQETFVRLYQWLDRLSSEKSIGSYQSVSISPRLFLIGPSSSNGPRGWRER